jgi:hypothetical protein
VQRPPKTPLGPPISLQADDYDADAPSEEHYSLAGYVQDEEAIEEVGEESILEQTAIQPLSSHDEPDGPTTPPVLMGEGVELQAEVPEADSDF